MVDALSRRFGAASGGEGSVGVEVEEGNDGDGEVESGEFGRGSSTAVASSTRSGAGGGDDAGEPGREEGAATLKTGAAGETSKSGREDVESLLWRTRSSSEGRAFSLGLNPGCMHNGRSCR